MSTPTSIHHGLSVLSYADASQRLAHPLDEYVRILGERTRRPVFNVFNDALTGVGYPETRAGHWGIDYLCDIGTPVKAMYGGVVTEIYTASNGSEVVTIESYTNSGQANRLGFQLRYGHLSHFHSDIGVDVPVKKGQVIGWSGITGTWIPHLHVDLRAFDSKGVTVNEHCPPLIPNPKRHTVTQVASRIFGYMNFACFLPADDDDIPTITQTLLNRGTGELLNVRTAYPFVPEPVSLPGFVPVYTSLPKRYNGRVSPLHSGWLSHSRIGCYAILGETQIGTYKFYQIQWQDHQKAWVPYKRKHAPFHRDIEAVQVEDASTPPLPSQAEVHTKQGSVKVYPYPSFDYIPNSHLGIPSTLGPLTVDQGYVIKGTHLDRTSAWPGITDSVVEQARRRWWQIDYDGQLGWVRSDKVNEAGPTSRIGLTWPPAPSHLQAEIRGRAVQVSWVPDPALAAAPSPLQASGYRVWRWVEDAHAGLKIAAVENVESARANDSLQQVEWTDAVPDPRRDRFYYQVATRIGDTVGPATALVSASTAPTQSVVVQPPGTPPGTPDPDPPVDTTAPPTAVPVTLESTQGSSLAVKAVPGGTATVSGFTLRQDSARDAVGYFHARVGRARQEWLRLRQAGTGAGAAGGASGQATTHTCTAGCR